MTISESSKRQKQTDSDGSDKEKKIATDKSETSMYFSIYSTSHNVIKNKRILNYRTFDIELRFLNISVASKRPKQTDSGGSDEGKKITKEKSKTSMYFSIYSTLHNVIKRK